MQQYEELGALTLAELTAPYQQKAVFCLTHRSDNKATLQKQALQQVKGNLYRGREEQDSFGTTSCVLYLYFEEYGYGVAADCVRQPGEIDLAAFLERADLSSAQSPEAYLAYLDRQAAEKKFINNAQIALARVIAPERAPLYEQARAAYYEESRRRDKARRKAREEEETAFCREENDKANAIVSQVTHAIRSDGEVENVNVTHYRGRYDGITHSVINYIAGLYGINIPISVQGWINRALVSFTIKNGQVTRYVHRGRSKSNTICGYLNQLIAAVRTAPVSAAA